MEDIKIRRAISEKDLEIIQKIEKINGNFWPNRYIRKDFLENPHSIYLLLEKADENVGYTTFMKIIDEIHINNIQILKEYRNMGLGQALIKSILDYYKDPDIVGATLEVAEDNLSAISLYRKMGFNEVGKRPGYYENKKTAILMYKTLEDKC